MATPNTSAADIRFEFGYYKFNGQGQRPTTVPTVNDANFIRSLHSIDGVLIDLAKSRVEEWWRQHNLNASMKQPYPSNTNGKYRLEFRFGGLTL